MSQAWDTGRQTIHSKAGVVKGDAADQWLLDNDPTYKRRRLHIAVVPPATVETFADLDDVVNLRLPDRKQPAVYFIQVGDGGPIKIGYCGLARKVPQRLQELQVGNPSPLVVRRVVHGSRRLETQLHKYFAEHRLSGEWFAPFEELVTLARAT